MRTFLRGGHREVERHLMNICIFHLSNVKSIHVFSRDVDADESGKSEWVDKHEFIWVVSRRVLPYFRIRRLVLYSPFFVSDFQHDVGPFCSHKKLRITTLFTAVSLLSVGFLWRAKSSSLNALKSLFITFTWISFHENKTEITQTILNPILLYYFEKKESWEIFSISLLSGTWPLSDLVHLLTMWMALTSLYSYYKWPLYGKHLPIKNNSLICFQEMNTNPHGHFTSWNEDCKRLFQIFKIASIFSLCLRSNQFSK